MRIRAYAYVYAYVNIHMGVNVCLIRITCVVWVYALGDRETYAYGPLRTRDEGSTGSQLAHSSGHSDRELLLREGRSPASLFVSYQLARRLHLATITASQPARSNSSRPRRTSNWQNSLFKISRTKIHSIQNYLVSRKLIPFFRFVIYIHRVHDR